MAKLTIDLWRDLQKIIVRLIKSLWQISVYILYVVILLYVFSLLETRLEFIVVSSFGLIYTVIAGQGIQNRNATISNLQLTMIAIGKLRLLLNDATKEDHQRGVETLNKLARERADWQWVDAAYLSIVEII